MSAGRGYVLGVNVTAEAAADKAANSYSAFWTFGANLGGRLIRAGLFARSDADNAQMAATGAVLKDVAARADLHTALRQLPAFMLKAEYQQIDASSVKKVLTAAVSTAGTEASSPLGFPLTLCSFWAGAPAPVGPQDELASPVRGPRLGAPQSAE